MIKKKNVTYGFGGHLLKLVTMAKLHAGHLIYGS